MMTNNSIRLLLSLLIWLAFFSLSYGQDSLTDSSVIIAYRNVFSSTCMEAVARKYNVHIIRNASGCYGPQYRFDSVERQNHRAAIFYEKRFGNDWLERITREIEVCELTKCNLDSVDHYTGNTIGVPLILHFQIAADSLNEYHLCVVHHSTLYYLQHSKTLKIAVNSHAAVGEEESSKTRGQHLMQYLLANGIAPERIVFTEYGSSELRLESMPEHRMNCRISIQVVHY